VRSVKKLLLIFIPLVVLVAQTNTTAIDLSPVVSMFVSILPLFLVIMVVALLFKMIGNIFENLGSVFRFVKLKLLALALPVALVAQTNTTAVIDLSAATQLTTSLVSILVPIVLVFVLIGFVLKFLSKLPDMIKV
jgi:hypothetical protein